MENTNPDRPTASSAQLDDFTNWLMGEGISLCEQGSGYDGMVLSHRRSHQLIIDYLEERKGVLEESVLDFFPATTLKERYE